MAGKPSFAKKQSDLFFSSDFANDFPVAMQVMVIVMVMSIAIWYVVLILYSLIADIPQVQFNLFHHQAWATFMN